MIRKPIQTFYYQSGSSFCPDTFSEQLRQFVSSYHEKNGLCPLRFFCIGSDRITGDSLGPFVGYKLEQYRSHLPKNIVPYQVIGTLSDPVHALNLNRTLDALSPSHMSYLTIAIDASLGSAESCGHITLSNQPLLPGEGIRRKLRKVGQISITGVVGNEKDPHPLQHTPLHTVIELADSICDGILTFLYSYNNQWQPLRTAPNSPGKSYLNS